MKLKTIFAFFCGAFVASTWWTAASFAISSKDSDLGALWMVAAASALGVIIAFVVAALGRALGDDK